MERRTKPSSFYTNLMNVEVVAAHYGHDLTMHVVFVLPRFFPYRGGYENSLLALAKYMVRHGHRVTVFTTVANDLEAFWLPEFRTLSRRTDRRRRRG